MHIKEILQINRSFGPKLYSITFFQKLIFIQDIYGQCGQGNRRDQHLSMPVKFETQDPISLIPCGANHSAAVSSNFFSPSLSSPLCVSALLSLFLFFASSLPSFLLIFGRERGLAILLFSSISFISFSSFIFP